jgi:RecG-like helicase
MKKASMLLTGIAGLVLLAYATPSFGAEEGKEGKEVTVTGEAKCAKCALHETSKCETVIQATEDGKPVTYHLKNNKEAKEFHENICQEPKKVTATGKVKTVDGKQELTVAKIEVAK